MTDFFFFGRLRDRDVRAAVLGVDLPGAPVEARIPEPAVEQGMGPDVDPGRERDAYSGLLVSVPPKAMARLEVWADVLGLTLAEAGLPDGRVGTYLHTGPEGPDNAALDRAIAHEIFALWPDRPVEELRRRLPQIAVRAQARLNADHPGPTTLRRQTRPGDVMLSARRQPYGGFFSVEEYELRHATFAGGESATLTRAAFISGDAVVVLPYDPVRDRVLLVEQFRAGPLARGDRELWSLETVAGRIDPGETPEAAARREAGEEAGLTLGALIALGRYYPSPGCVAEFLYTFAAETDLSDLAPGQGGLADEGEDIRTHILPFDTLMALIESGEVNNGPLMLIALMLDRKRAELRQL